MRISGASRKKLLPRPNFWSKKAAFGSLLQRNDFGPPTLLSLNSIYSEMHVHLCVFQTENPGALPFLFGHERAPGHVSDMCRHKKGTSTEPEKGPPESWVAAPPLWEAPSPSRIALNTHWRPLSNMRLVNMRARTQSTTSPALEKKRGGEKKTDRVISKVHAEVSLFFLREGAEGVELLCVVT